MGSLFSAGMLAVQALFLSVLACAHARVATHQESFDQDRPDQFRQDALHLAPAVIHQPRGLIWDWLVGGSKGGTTPRPVRRPGDRQDESPTADLTGTWILGYPARRLHSVPGLLNVIPKVPTVSCILGGLLSTTVSYREKYQK